MCDVQPLGQGAKIEVFRRFKLASKELRKQGMIGNRR
jgi:hypothetical protein